LKIFKPYCVENKPYSFISVYFKMRDNSHIKLIPLITLLKKKETHAFRSTYILEHLYFDFNECSYFLTYEIV